MKMKNKPPEKTPEWVSISTGNAQIDRSFKIAVDLVDGMRKKYFDKTGKKGWLPVSDGIRGAQNDSSDLRDSAHMVKMSSYLWGYEEDIQDVVEKSLFFDVIDKDGVLAHPCTLGDLYPAHIGMYSRCASDFYKYFLPGKETEKAIKKIVRMIKWATRKFDSENSGFFDTRSPENKYKVFWGMHLGEPSHQVINLDPKSKAIIPSMAFTVLLGSLFYVFEKISSPEKGFIKNIFEMFFKRIEKDGWSEESQYYYIQYDRISNRYFFSFNGLNEKSREVDIIPHYCSEMDVENSRKNGVARYINKVIREYRIFPMPVFYPTYSWFSAYHPNGIDVGENASQMGGAWDTPYFHSVNLLNRTGFCEAVELGIRKRAEAICRDNDCLEWYFLDGTVDHSKVFIRDRYLVSATAHISAIIESLFGIKPLSPGFEKISFYPCFPIYRKHRHTLHPSPWAEKDISIKITLPYGKKLEFTLKYSEKTEKITIKTNSPGAEGYFRIPVDFSQRVKKVIWGNREINYRIEKHNDRDFIFFRHKLDGKIVQIYMNPHPDKGKGTTPLPPESI